MNLATTHNPLKRNRRHPAALTVSLLVLLLLNFLSAAAQSRGQKRITSVWTTTTSAGSTVHVVSDTTVGDYEAYTRGGRFYVKIPAADLPSARGSLLGRGFDDVQIQCFGDGIIISFHLLPGTLARVQQVDSRLDIIFATPGKAATLATNLDDASRTRTRTVGEISGSSSGASQSSRPTNRSANRRIASPGSTGSRSGKGVESDASQATVRVPEVSEPTPQKQAVASSPLPATSPIDTPAVNIASSSSSPNSGSSSTSSSAAQGSPIQQPSLSSTPVPDSKTETMDWRSRANYWKVWAELNWIPILIGSVIGVALLVLLFFWRGAKRLHEAGSEVPRERDVASSKPVGNRNIPEPAVLPTVPQANAASAGAGSSQTSAANQSQSSNTLPAEPDRPQAEDQEREVFEL